MFWKCGTKCYRVSHSDISQSWIGCFLNGALILPTWKNPTSWHFFFCLTSCSVNRVTILRGNSERSEKGSVMVSSISVLRKQPPTVSYTIDFLHGIFELLRDFIVTPRQKHMKQYLVFILTLVRKQSPRDGGWFHKLDVTCARKSLDFRRFAGNEKRVKIIRLQWRVI